jgi:hypothetical protein
MGENMTDTPPKHNAELGGAAGELRSSSKHLLVVPALAGKWGNRILPSLLSA